MKKALVIAAVSTAVGLTSVIGVGAADAATSNVSSSSSNPMSSLIQKIATKFNLKESDVKAVFDEDRSEMEQKNEASLVSQQAQLVKDGKLTQAQSDAITAKRAELKKEREAEQSSEQSKTDTERKTEMEARKTALDTWLKEKGISTDYAYLLMGGGKGGDGPGGPRGSSSATTSSSTMNS